MGRFLMDAGTAPSTGARRDSIRSKTCSEFNVSKRGALADFWYTEGMSNVQKASSASKSGESFQW